jgi:hypothetical protein
MATAISSSVKSSGAFAFGAGALGVFTFASGATAGSSSQRKATIDMGARYHASQRWEGGQSNSRQRPLDRNSRLGDSSRSQRRKSNHNTMGNLFSPANLKVIVLGALATALGFWVYEKVKSFLP